MRLPENTKFFIWSRKYGIEPPGRILEKLLSKYADLKKSRGWTFEMPMPVNVKEEPVYKTQKRLFSSKTYEQLLGLEYYLEFDCELNTEQLMFWRGFVTGFLASFGIRGR